MAEKEEQPKISETALALIEMFSLLAGTMIVGSPERRKGFDDYLATVRDHFRKNGQKKAAAIIETARRKATAEGAGPDVLNALVEKKKVGKKPN